MPVEAGRTACMPLLPVLYQTAAGKPSGPPCSPQTAASPLAGFRGAALDVDRDSRWGQAPDKKSEHMESEIFASSAHVPVPNRGRPQRTADRHKTAPLSALGMSFELVRPLLCLSPSCAQ